MFDNGASASPPTGSVVERGLRARIAPIVVDVIDVPLHVAARRARAGIPTGAVELDYVGPSHAPRPEARSGEGRPPQPGELLPVAAMSPEQIAAELQRLDRVDARTAAHRAELVVGLAEQRPAWADRRAGRPGAASGEWAAELLDGEVSEFFPDELAVILNCSRAQATNLWEASATLVRRLPATRAALAAGLLDRPRAWALAAEWGWPARETPDAVLAAVEAVLLPRAAQLSVKRLRALARAELIAADPAAADRRRERALRGSDVTVRGLGDGMAELRSPMPAPDATAVYAEVDAHARAAKGAGDERPIGQLRAAVLTELVTRPWQERPAVSAHVTVDVALDTLEAAAAGEAGPGVQPGTVDGQPVTATQVRELLERVDALCPGGLRPPTGGTLDIAVVDGEGRLLAGATRAELDRAARRGEGLDRPPAVDRYQPTPAQRRLVNTRDCGCRHPGCPNTAGWADLDHVVPHAAGGATDCANLCCLCRRHHRLKTHARGWIYAMSPDGVLTVITPSGVTRVSRPPGLHDRAGPDDPDPPPF